jgi:predicted DNA-binding transcriptional regulator YafY
MAEKLSPYRSYGQKLITLFARLLFSGESYSLTELSKMLGCSKQTVLRLVDDIRRSYGIEVEESFKGRKKYYKIRKESGGFPIANMTTDEMAILQMCRAFTERLIGRELFEEAAVALGKSRRLLKNEQQLTKDHFGSFVPGTIDYTPHHGTFLSLVKAMEEKSVCKVTYHNVIAKRAKSFYVKPLKLFSRKETVYLHAALALAPGKSYREPEFTPLLAVHRIAKVQITDRKFTIPDDFDFEKDFNQTFGIMKDDAFTVEAEFSKSAARYVAERSWSPNQKIKRLRDGRIRLIYSASSESETISWILSFGSQVRILKPARLKNRLKETIKAMYKQQVGCQG